MNMVQQYRVGFSVLRHTTGHLSSLQVVILSFTGALSKKINAFLLFPHCLHIRISSREVSGILIRCIILFNSCRVNRMLCLTERLL